MGTGKLSDKPDEMSGSYLQWTSILSKMSSNTPSHLTLFRLGFFLLTRTGGGEGEGGLRRPYTCNSPTAYCMTPQFTQNDVVIISII